MNKKKRLFIDLDGVIVDLIAQVEVEFAQIESGTYKEATDLIDFSETVFLDAEPIKDALKSVAELEKYFEVYILSTAPWKNTLAWMQKRIWVEKHLPSMYKRLILTHNKELLNGDFLIDDRLHNGADEFEGEHLHIFTPKFPDWKSVTDYLIQNQ
ncbi:5' nucleotidase, NT5C type [Moheibacter sp.]|uniref:5' nucleotidase, NT5C type n=1 Tax=Moheibacter sp. TaxID=1965316 RepID=UPI003C747719